MVDTACLNLKESERNIRDKERIVGLTELLMIEHFFKRSLVFTKQKQELLLLDGPLLTCNVRE